MTARGQGLPAVSRGARIPGPVVGVVDYAFGRYRVLPSTPPTVFSRLAAPTRPRPCPSIASVNSLGRRPRAGNTNFPPRGWRLWSE
jgi:hypothetical protein